MYNPLRLAVLIPCYNEEVAIGTVVRDFQRVLPQATIYVFDNNSRDRTVDIARSHGAVVRHVPLQGKGNVMRRMFADIEADIYILVDGDDTYHAQSSPQMIDTLLAEGLDMVVGRRKSTEVESYRLGHRLGNRMLTGFVAQLFGRRFIDTHGTIALHVRMTAQRADPRPRLTYIAFQQQQVYQLLDVTDHQLPVSSRYFLSHGTLHMEHKVSIFMKLMGFLY